jgi:hypothetical protein
MMRIASDFLVLDLNAVYLLFSLPLYTLTSTSI